VKTWNIHKTLLIERSPFFKGALAGGFVESAISTVYLPKERNRPFSIIVHWLYSTLFLAGPHFLQVLEDLNPYVLVSVYYTAERLLIDQLKTEILSTLYNRPYLSTSIMPDSLHLIEEQAAAQCPLSELLLDQVAHGIASSLIKLDREGDASNADRQSAEAWSQLFENGGWITSSIIKRIGAQSRMRGRRSLAEYLGEYEIEYTGQEPHKNKKQCVGKVSSGDLIPGHLGVEWRVSTS